MCLTASAVAQLCMGAEPGKSRMFDYLDLSPNHKKSISWLDKCYSIWKMSRIFRFLCRLSSSWLLLCALWSHGKWTNCEILGECAHPMRYFWIPISLSVLCSSIVWKSGIRQADISRQVWLREKISCYISILWRLLTHYNGKHVSKVFAV